MTVSPFSGHPLFEQFSSGQAIGQDDRLGFACRGCGHLCCVNTDVLTSPVEAVRITWHIHRNPALLESLVSAGTRWGEMFVGGSTGLPLVRLNFVSFDEARPEMGRHCPFLAPVYDRGGRWLDMAWCIIREARPAVCRLFPVGRARHGIESGEWDYRVVARCPGFAPAAPGEAVPPGYVPPDPGQTVRDWVAAQCDPEQDEEKAFYMGSVIPAFMAAGAHASTEHNAGRLTERAVLAMGERLFYNPPPVPGDLAQDHEVIMEWLAFLRDSAAAIEGLYRQASRAGAMSDSAIRLR